METTIFYIWAMVLILANAGCWICTLFTLPGNWMLLLCTTLFAYFYPASDDGYGIQWWVIAVLLLLAIVGEVIEFAAGAAGAAKQGASRRAMALAMVGTVVGSLAGAAIGIPIPVAGLIIGALGGGALGAFGGAYLGEVWKGKSTEESVSVGKGAMVGRVLGTIVKLIVGAAMFAIATFATFSVLF